MNTFLVEAFFANLLSCMRKITKTRYTGVLQYREHKDM